MRAKTLSALIVPGDGAHVRIAIVAQFDVRDESDFPAACVDHRKHHRHVRCVSYAVEAGLPSWSVAARTFGGEDEVEGLDESAEPSVNSDLG